MSIYSRKNPPPGFYIYAYLRDDDWNKKHSESLKRLPKITCPICNKTMDSSHYKRFGHGYDCKSLLSTTQLVKGLS